MVIKIELSGCGTLATEVGVRTTTGSAGLNLVANIKKVKSKKATSHIAVISTLVLFLGNLCAMINYLNCLIVNLIIKQDNLL